MDWRFAVILSASSVLLVAKAGNKNNVGDTSDDYYDYDVLDEWTWDFSGYDWTSAWESFDFDSWSGSGESTSSNIWNYGILESSSSWDNSWGMESLGSWTSWGNDWYTSWSQDFSSSWSSWGSWDTWSSMDTWNPWDDDYQWLSDWSPDDYMDSFEDDYSTSWASFGWDWSDFNSIWTDIEWNVWNGWNGWDLYFTEMPSYTEPYTAYRRPRTLPPTLEPPVYLDIEKYWSGDPYTDWCRESWDGEILSDDLQVEVEEFMESGNITTWCLFTGQVMLVSDLSNLNLNDPGELPSMFIHDLPDYCTAGVCRRHLLKRSRFDAVKLVEQTLRIMNIYRRLDCLSCFCKSQNRATLDKVLAITKDHLKKTGVMSYTTTEESPEEVVTYFQELKLAVGLEDVEQPPRKKYTTLLDMDQAIEGPGKDVLRIKKYADLAKGIYYYCSK